MAKYTLTSAHLRTGRSLARRFWARVDMDGDCWLWRGHKNEKGYGLIRVDGKQVRAHRVAYELSFGRISDGLSVCHSCDNPACVRPVHLWLGTRGDNNRDAKKKGRSKNQNTDRTHCRRGHEFTPENTETTKMGRQCRACRRLLWPAKYERKRQRELALGGGNVRFA